MLNELEVRDRIREAEELRQAAWEKANETADRLRSLNDRCATAGCDVAALGREAAEARVEHDNSMVTIVWCNALVAAYATVIGVPKS